MNVRLWLLRRLMPGTGVVYNCFIEAYDDGVVITGPELLHVTFNTFIGHHGENAPPLSSAQLMIHTDKSAVRWGAG